jgi:hypothetical protein
VPPTTQLAGAVVHVSNAPDGNGMPTIDLIVEFPEHLSGSRIDGLVTGIAAYGNVAEAEHPRTYRVSVFRASKLPELEQQLVSWERYGFLRWQRAV